MGYIIWFLRDALIDNGGIFIETFFLLIAFGMYKLLDEVLWLIYNITLEGILWKQ